MSDITLGVSQWCTDCEDVVSVGHSNQHDDPLGVDVLPIRKAGSEYIAQPRDMGHVSPHVWVDVDDREVCGECNAIKLPEEYQ